MRILKKDYISTFDLLSKTINNVEIINANPPPLNVLFVIVTSKSLFSSLYFGLFKPYLRIKGWTKNNINQLKIRDEKKLII